MQNAITGRRIQYNWVALIAALVAVAMSVGFVAGRAVSTPSSGSIKVTNTAVGTKVGQRLFELNERFYPSPIEQPKAPTGNISAVPARPKDAAALKDAQLEQMDAVHLGASVPVTSYGVVEPESADQLRRQRLLELNEIFYPSPSEPTFWNGRPH